MEYIKTVYHKNQDQKYRKRGELTENPLQKSKQQGPITEKRERRVTKKKNGR